ncbi:MAG: hypothetical protein UW75_C0024G0004 [Parcubacteria group bacterium GW2011_GWF2_44_8]|nr:MAG: hypothetical protein UW75_C0024G0004 [Parcubacteria group bacterium GW2011_GWF2_44_8]
MTTTQTTILPNLFTFDENKTEEAERFLEEVGTLVFQSALMRYLAAHTDEESSVFEVYVEEHVAQPSFMDDLCLEYPEFENFLKEEMMAFSSDVHSLQN